MFLGLQENMLSQMDRYLVHGDKYKALRDTVGKAILQNEPLTTVAVLKVGPAPGLPLYHTAPLGILICLIGVK